MCRVAVVAGAFVVCAWLTGCGKPEPAVHPVSGTVKFADGKPVGGCTVEFTSEAPDTKGMNAVGDVKEDGTFELKTNVNGKLKDGAVAGAHKVIVIGPSPSSGGPPVATVPPRYQAADKSGLTFEVKPGPNEYPITLSRE